MVPGVVEAAPLQAVAQSSDQSEHRLRDRIRVAADGGRALAEVGAAEETQLEHLALARRQLVGAAMHGFPEGGPWPGVVRWNGATWSAVGSLVQGQVTALTNSPTGEVLVGGTFDIASGVVSSGIARLTTSCPATVQSLGVGCAGGTVTSSLPWTGSQWRASASGLPNVALVFVVNGFAPASLPLSAVFSTALPGCTLQVQADQVSLIVATGGTASVQFLLPDTQALVGTVFHHQMVPLALDSTLAVTATNVLTLTSGSF